MAASKQRARALRLSKDNAKAAMVRAASRCEALSADVARLECAQRGETDFHVRSILARDLRETREAYDNARVALREAMRRASETREAFYDEVSL